MQEYAHKHFNENAISKFSVNIILLIKTHMTIIVQIMTDN